MGVSVTFSVISGRWLLSSQLPVPSVTMTTERLHQQQTVMSAGEGVNVQSRKNKTKKFTVTISPGSAHLRGGAQFYQGRSLLEPQVLKGEDGCKTIQLTNSFPPILMQVSRLVVS